MKAIIAQNYGSPDVLKLKEIKKPFPKDGEVLIKVCASSINSADYRMMRAKPFFIRFMGQGLLRPKRPVPGIEMAGVIEAVGKDVTLFKAGDKVYGDVYSSGTGAYAEYICVPECSNVVIKPSNMTFEQAATVPVAGLTALQALRDHGQVQAGHKVLVNGASGGVGTFTVILAKAFGAEVTGVCSTRNLDLIRSIGADQVIDYKKQDLAQSEKRYDLIIDIAANITADVYRRMLTLQGTGVLIGFSSFSHLLSIMREGKKTAGKGGVCILAMGMARANKQDLDVLREMMESERIMPVIDRIYPLEQTAQAMRYFGEKHARAKVVISMCEGSLTK